MRRKQMRDEEIRELRAVGSEWCASCFDTSVGQP